MAMTTTAAATAAKKKVPANTNRKLDFKAGDHVVYPTHGVGRIVKVEEQEVTGITLELFVITFDKDKMTLRVPTAKAKAVGMRKLSSPDIVNNALNTLKGRARIKRTMWSRRAQEYEAKINSGDLVAIAEVVRDLHRATGQPEQSYSERQLYEKKFSGKHVVFLSQRTILSKTHKRSHPGQIRPRSRTLTAVHEALLDELVHPTQIVGKRIRVRVDGTRLLKVYLDPKDVKEVDYKLKTFGAVYRALTNKAIEFTFPVEE